jgi:hypothetical protein
VERERRPVPVRLPSLERVPCCVPGRSEAGGYVKVVSGQILGDLVELAEAVFQRGYASACFRADLPPTGGQNGDWICLRQVADLFGGHAVSFAGSWMWFNASVKRGLGSHAGGLLGLLARPEQVLDAVKSAGADARLNAHVHFFSLK